MHYLPSHKGIKEDSLLPDKPGLVRVYQTIRATKTVINNAASALIPVNTTLPTLPFLDFQNFGRINIFEIGFSYLHGTPCLPRSGNMLNLPAKWPKHLLLPGRQSLPVLTDRGL